MQQQGGQWNENSGPWFEKNISILFLVRIGVKQILGLKKCWSYSMPHYIGAFMIGALLRNNLQGCVAII